jgi:drug/metabolite transporter (DMT)-like permease
MKTANLELHVAVLLFGVTGLFGKFITASPLIIVFGRTASAAVIILLGLKVCKVGLAASSKKARFLMLLSGLVLMIHWVIFFYSIQISTVAIGVIGFSTFPVFVTFLEPILFKQKLRNVDIASGVLVVIGLLLVVPGLSLSNSSTIGLLWAVFSGALYAVLALMNRRLVETNSFMLIAFYQHSTAALCLLPFVFAGGEIPDFRTIWLLVILGVVFTALPQSLFIKSLKFVKAQLASIVIGLESVYGIFFAALLLGEIPNMRTVAGAIVVLGAVMLAMKAHSTPEHEIGS